MSHTQIEMIFEGLSCVFTNMLKCEDGHGYESQQSEEIF